MIQFYTEDISFDFHQLSNIPSWIESVVASEDFSLQEVNFIFCSDQYLLQINIFYLQHDYFTDIITFDNSDQPGVIEGDIFISIDRVQENSLLQQTSFINELLRVVIHGILHLMGYDDKDDNSKITMRKMEDKCLSLYFSSFHKE